MTPRSAFASARSRTRLREPTTRGPALQSATVTTFEQLTLILAGAAIVINAGLFVGFGLQLRLLRAQIRQASDATSADHARRRKEATFEFAVGTAEQYWELSTPLPTAPEDLATYLSTSENEATVLRILELRENMATGVNLDILDLEMIDRLEGRRIVSAWKTFAPFVLARRRALNQPSYCCELEQLAATIEALPQDR